MRNPRRWRAIALAALPLGALLIHAANRQGSQLVGAAFGFSGICALLFGVFMGWRAHRVARAQARLVEGDGVLARWRVAASEWQAFIVHERSLSASNDVTPNELALSAEVPADGIEIVIGEDAISVGGSVHLLPRHGAPEVTQADLHDQSGAGPHVATLQLRHPPSARRDGSLSPPLHTRLSFPLPAAAWRDARRAIGFYAQGRPGKASFFHGPGDGSDPEDLSTCARCRYRTHVYRSTCPQCGGGMLSKRWTRRFGAVLILLGGLLASGMLVLLVKLSPMLAAPGVQHGNTRFAGTPMQALVIWGILGGVFLFGAIALAAGISQVATGKRNLRAASVLVGIFSVLMTIAVLFAGK